MAKSTGAPNKAAKKAAKKAVKKQSRKARAHGEHPHTNIPRFEGATVRPEDTPSGVGLEHFRPKAASAPLAGTASVAPLAAGGPPELSKKRAKKVANG